MLSVKVPGSMGVTTVSGAAIGRSPFDPRSWSGSNRNLHLELQRRGLLRRALVAQERRHELAAALARNATTDRAVLRARLNLDVGYRNALTRSLREQLNDDGSPVLQIAGYYDVTRLLSEETPRFAYYDGNLAAALASPYPPRHVPDSSIDACLAYEKDLLGRMTAVFTMSEYLRRSFIDDYGLGEEKVVTIGGGINVSSMPEEPVGKSWRRKSILFVGREFSRKGGEVLLEAFLRVRQHHPEAVLHVVGAQAPRRSRSKFHHNVVFHGALDRAGSEMAFLWRTASLFVMPSLWEPFGIAPLEAMAHQIPAVLTDDWALREMVTPRVTGSLVPAGDADRLASEVIELLGNPGELERMGRAAREVVLKRYTWPAVVDRLTDAMRTAS